MSAAGKTISPLLHPSELGKLQLAVADLQRDQLLWASGYLAGLAAREVLGDVVPADSAAAVPVAAGDPGEVWTVLYATETGNSRYVAEQLAADVSAAGLAVKVTDVRDYKPTQLKKERRLLFVVATHGLGDPPEGTEAFFEYLLGPRAPELSQLSFAVLALGDSSYEDFCLAGQRADERLAELGATRLTARVDCDLDFEDVADAWVERVVSKARDEKAVHIAPVHPLHAVSPAPTHSRRNPFRAELLTNQKITAQGSSKDVRHIELSLEGSSLTYEPGDSLGVVANNPEPLVEQFLALLEDDGGTTVTVGTESTSLAEALSTRLELTNATRLFVEAHANTSGSEKLAALLHDRGALAQYLQSNQVIDILRQHPAELAPQQLVTSLGKLTPRLYSIASSLHANPDEAHLTVAVVSYDKDGFAHFGAASKFLAGSPTTVPVYVEPNHHFRLPEDSSAPIIMVGPGTGIAPFRAFLEQRRHDGARGRNWLVFGDRTRRNDFLYQLEWQRYLKEGVLTRLDVAFSRDQPEKLYVQQRLKEEGAQVYAWLMEGAHIYVCGDAQTMAGDVHQALVDIVAEHSGRASDAESFLKDLKAQGRYQRDVY
jgi:sulfite reductase (NADPH) flavoprotein alpha-component